MPAQLAALLRSPATAFYEYSADNGALLKQAADEIDRLRKALRSADRALTIVEDHGTLGGGAMGHKYNMDPMEGYDFVLRHSRRAQKKVKAALDAAEYAAAENGA